MNAIVVALMVFVASLRLAHADGEDIVKPSYRVVIDHVDQEPASVGGTRLSIYVSALTLQGQRLDLAEPNSIKTVIGASELKAPYAIGNFASTKMQLAIVLVVQATLDYSEVLPIIVEQVDSALLSHLDDRTLFAVLPYGEAVGTGKLAPLKTARTKLGSVSQDGTAGDPALIETVERALILLKKAKTNPEGLPLRKLVLVVGDGRDRAGDKDRVTRLGARAAKEGVRIHTFAYSPTDQRRPLLLLGELSRKSLGTFRWLQMTNAKADSWGGKFGQMLEEIQKQYVLTYFLGADDDPAGKKLKVQTVGRTEATSNEAKAPAAECGNEVCGGYCVDRVCYVPREPEGRGVFGWVLLVGGIGLGAVVLLGLVGFVLSKRSQPIPLPPGVELPPGTAPPVKAPKPKKQKGKPMPVPGMPGMPVAPAPQAQSTAFLMFLGGQRAGERVVIFNGFMIGKLPTSHLVIEDGYTSSTHAQLVMDATGTWQVYDMGSTNGTFIDGNRISQSPLTSGVTLRIGGTDLRFLVQ